MVLLRRLILLLSIIGAGAAGYAVWQRRDQPSDHVPEWPPLPDASAAARSDGGSTTEASGDPEATGHVEASGDQGATDAAWVPPDAEGQCPLDHPVKLNEDSGIFHVPGGRFYERTRADRCYASAEAASADGYRAAKA